MLLRCKLLFLVSMKLPVDLIENELKTFEVKFKNAVSSQAPMLDRIMRYIVKRKGKQLRPMFVFFLQNFAERSMSRHTGPLPW